MEKLRKIKSPILETAGYLAITVILCFFLQKIVVPKYMSHPVEGAMMREYYESEATHDIIFIGDCEFYESITPVILWERYGITSYVRGSAQQLIWQSYYVLKDTLLIEKPKAVVFNVTELKYGETQNEAYTRLCLDGMKSLKYRLAAAGLSLKEENESLLSFVFPILRYHSRWSELSSDDFEYMFKRNIITYEGYLMHTEVRPATGDSPALRPLFDSSFPDICWEYLDKIYNLCEEEGIELVLFKSPVISWQYPWYDEWDEQINAYAESHDILYINGIELSGEMGLDMSTDTYDEGIHLNVYGAEKCTDFLGSILVSAYDYTDNRNDPDQCAVWDKIKNRYYEARDGIEE